MTNTTRTATLLFLAVACGADTKAPAPRAPVASSSAAPAVSVALSSSALPAPPPKPPLGELIDRALAEVEAAWMARDAQKLAAVYSADVEVRITLPTDGWKPLKKPDAEAQLAQLFATFPDARLTTTRTLRMGPVVAAEGYFTASSAGKKVGCPVLTLSWFEDGGLVKAQHVVFDPGTILGQLGKGDRKAKLRAVDPIPTAPIVSVTAGDTPDETKNALSVRAYYASGAAAKGASPEVLWAVGRFVVAELSVGAVRGVDVFELLDGKMKPIASYGPHR
ncbi:MAG TPA: nuclear transport factor 2 family protein [Polyangiaceae bacterium]